MSSSLAVKRLTKDLKELIKNPLHGTSAEPVGDDMLTWHCTTLGPDGSPYQDVPIHWELKFNEYYPVTPPMAFFITHFKSISGSAGTDDKGRMYICMNIFSNYSNRHSEWIREKEGWSPTMTVSTILIQFQLSLADSNLISFNPDYVSSTKEKCQAFICSECGHNGGSLEKYKPAILSYKKTIDQSESTDQSVKNEKSVENEKALVIYQPPKITLHLTRKQQNDTSSVASTKNEVAIVSDEIKSTIMCVVTHQNLLEDPNAIFGFGFNFNDKPGRINNKVHSPFEYLSLEGFNTGARSSLKIEMTEWFPIYLNNEHWIHAKPEFDARLNKLLKSPEDPHELLEFFSKIMRSIFEDNHVINETFTQGYFSFFRTLVNYRNKLTTYLEENIFNLVTFWSITDFSEFIDNSQSPLKNINRMSTWMLAIMLLNPPWDTELKTAILREFRARKIAKVYRELNISHSETKFEKIDQLMFDRLKKSIHIICFQLEFWKIVRGINFDLLESKLNILDHADIKLMMDMNRKIKSISNWTEFYTRFDCNPDEELKKQHLTIVDIQNYSKQRLEEQPEEKMNPLTNFSESRINQILDGMEKYPEFIQECPDAIQDGHECGNFYCYDKWDRLIFQPKEKERQKREQERMQEEARKNKEKEEAERNLRLSQEREIKIQKLKKIFVKNLDNFEDILNNYKKILDPNGNLSENDLLNRIENQIEEYTKFQLEQNNINDFGLSMLFMDEKDRIENEEHAKFKLEQT